MPATHNQAPGWAQNQSASQFPAAKSPDPRIEETARKAKQARQCLYRDGVAGAAVEHHAESAHALRSGRRHQTCNDALAVNESRTPRRGSETRSKTRRNGQLPNANTTQGATRSAKQQHPAQQSAARSKRCRRADGAAEVKLTCAGLDDKSLRVGAHVGERDELRQRVGAQEHGLGRVLHLSTKHRERISWISPRYIRSSNAQRYLHRDQQRPRSIQPISTEREHCAREVKANAPGTSR